MDYSFLHVEFLPLIWLALSQYLGIGVGARWPIVIAMLVEIGFILSFAYGVANQMARALDIWVFTVKKK